MTDNTVNSDNDKQAKTSDKGRQRRHRRPHGRDRQRQGASGVPPINRLIRKIPVYDILSDEGAEIIEQNAEVIGEEIGMRFSNAPHILDLWREAGADVREDRVRFPKGLLKQLTKTAPSQFTLNARNPERGVTIGGNNTVLAPVYGPPFVSDMDNGRRYGTNADFQNFVKLAYMTPYLHLSGGTICEPVDLPVNKRHFDMIYNHIKYSDKPFMGSVTAGERAEDTIDMVKILFGEKFVDDNCVLISLINANSPLSFDDTMLAALEVYARNNQACIVSPFILAGAMSPVTIAGTLSQLWVEAMSGVALTQLIRKGAPVVFGAFVSTISMQSGAPTFGSPEASKLLNGAAKLARRANLPFRSGGSFCASKVPDAQAAYETANTLNSSLMAGVNFMLHAAGWLEGGLVSSYEKFVMDVDQLGMMHVMAEGIDIDENALALDALREVGPGGHFLGAAHTQKNFASAFYRSNIADNNSFEQWQAEGSLDAYHRANAIYKKVLADYQAPALDPGIDENLQSYIKQRKDSFPDASY